MNHHDFVYETGAFWPPGGLAEVVNPPLNSHYDHSGTDRSKNAFKEGEEYCDAWANDYLAFFDDVNNPPFQAFARVASHKDESAQMLNKMQFEEAPHKLSSKMEEITNVKSSSKSSEEPDRTEYDEGLGRNSKKVSKKKTKSAMNKNETIRRRNWTPQEDEMLLKLVKELGPAWSVISQRMEGSRNGKQVRARYANKLNPKIKTSDWTPEEDALLVRLCQKYGRRWAEFTKYLPGRTDTALKNRVRWRHSWLLENSQGPLDSRRSHSNDAMDILQGNKEKVDLLQHYENNDALFERMHSENNVDQQRLDMTQNTCELAKQLSSMTNVSNGAKICHEASTNVGEFPVKSMEDAEETETQLHSLTETIKGHLRYSEEQPQQLIRENGQPSREGATKRIELLKTRLKTLESLLRTTYQEVLKVQGT